MKMKIDSVTKCYGKNTALDNISLSLPREPIALLGPNGAGKSTLLRILSTLTKPDNGMIQYGSLNWEDKNSVRKSIGYLPQHFSFYPYLTVNECLEYIGAMKGVRQNILKQYIDASLDNTNLLEYKNKRIYSLSGGTLRRVGIAQALLTQPEILLVDEPTAGLDAEEQLRFRHLISRNTTNRLSIISTHIASDIDAMCNYIVLIKKGVVLYQGAKSEFIANASGWIKEETINTNDYYSAKKDVRITRVVQKSDGKLQIRYILPDKSNSPCEPTIEDAYMLMLSQSR